MLTNATKLYLNFISSTYAWTYVNTTTGDSYQPEVGFPGASGSVRGYTEINKMSMAT